MALFLTRVVGFRAEHHFGRPDLPREANLLRFGPLALPHAHDYTCAATVTGPLDPGSGMLIDLALLDQLLAQEVGRLDGGDLNRDVAAVRRRSAAAYL